MGRDTGSDMSTTELTSAHAGAPRWQDAVETCLERLGTLPDGGNLGFVYVTDHFADALGEVVARLRSDTGIAHWVGTVGLGVCAPGVEYFDTPAMTLLAGRFPQDTFRVFSGVVSDLDAFEREHGAWCDDVEPRFGVVHADPGNGSIPALIEALCRRMGEGFLVGGLASSRGATPQVADALVQGGMSGVLFAPQVAVATRLTQGCSPLGPRREITRARANVLLELDARPALDVFYEDIGEILTRHPEQIGARVFAGLPVAGSDTGDYLVRNLVGADPQGRALAVAEQVEEGASIIFCQRDAPSAERDLRRMLAELARHAGEPAKAGLYHTCLARGPNLFAPAEELTIIESALGAFPLAGFFGNGEISHDRLYGYTGVLTLFL